MKEEIVKQLMEWLKMSGDFLMTEAPAYIQEYLAYQAWEAKMWMFGMMVCSLICVAIIAVLFCIGWGADFSTQSDIAGITVFVVLLGAVFGIGALCSWFDIKKIELAPKVVALEHIGSLTR